MAVNRDNTLIGVGVVSVSAYVAAAGSGSFTELGHQERAILTPTKTNFDMMSDRSRGPIRVLPVDSEHKLKVVGLEITAANLQQFLEQPAANKTGTTPDFTVRVGHPNEIYWQLKIVGPGLGTALVRTITLWRCVLETVGDIVMAKGDTQKLDLTFRVLNDDTVTTADKAYLIVDS